MKRLALGVIVIIVVLGACWYAFFGASNVTNTTSVNVVLPGAYGPVPAMPASSPPDALFVGNCTYEKQQVSPVFETIVPGVHSSDSAAQQAQVVRTLCEQRGYSATYVETSYAGSSTARDYVIYTCSALVSATC